MKFLLVTLVLLTIGATTGCNSTVQDSSRSKPQATASGEVWFNELQTVAEVVAMLPSSLQIKGMEVIEESGRVATLVLSVPTTDSASIASQYKDARERQYADLRRILSASMGQMSEGYEKSKQLELDRLDELEAVAPTPTNVRTNLIYVVGPADEIERFRSSR